MPDSTLHPDMIRLVGDRLIVREWRADEARTMHRWLGDPTVMGFLNFGTASLDETREHLALVLREQGRTDRERYWLRLKSANRAA